MSGQDLSYVSVQEVITAALGKTVGAANQLPTELQNTALIRELQDINNDFHELGRVMMKKPFWWMEDFFNFKTYDRTTISALTGGQANSATIASATGWKDTGKAYVEDSDGGIEFFEFANAAGTLTIADGEIDIDHAANSNVELLYSGPENFGEFISMNLDRVPYYPYDPVPDTLPFNPHFWFAGEFMLFPKQIGSHTGTLRYWKKPATLENDDLNTALSTVLDIPKKYRNYPIFRLAAHISMVRRRYDMEASFERKAEKKLLEACQFEVSATSNPSATIGPSW